MFRKLFIYVALLLVDGVYGQELKVIKELSSKTDDIFARTHPVYVGYGEEKQLCAAIKVALILPEVKFADTFFKQQTEGSNGEYVVYVAPGCKKLKVMGGSFLPLEYHFPSPVESGNTYQLVLGLPDSNESLIRLSVNVKTAQIDIAGQHYETENGFFEVRIPRGEYDYTVSTNATGFDSVSGHIIVDDIFKSERVVLPTINSFKLTINADDGSRIVVDGVTQQKLGSQILTIPAGLHTVESFMGDDDRWTKRLTVDLTKDNAMADMSMRGNLRITYPTNALFELTPLNNALSPTKKSFKTGEIISLLGEYDIKVIKKNYTENHANVTIPPNADVDNFRVEVVSNGDNYFYGINGTKQDYQKAFKEYEKMAKKGDDLAQYKLAFCYDNGYGVMKDLSKAISFYKMASEAGQSKATYELARLTDNQEERASYYLMAADQGNLLSMKIAGDYFIQIKAYSDALKYYLMAAKTNISETNNSETETQAACFAAIGEMYFQGKGVERDLEMARSFFNQGVAMDNPLANERLIDYVYFGYNGKPDKASAISHYKHLGDSLTDKAKLRVALYEYDHQAFTEANTYFSKLFNSDVQFPEDIGEIFYRMGEKMYNVDKPAAFYYYNTAKKNGIIKPRQMIRLGYMYLNGQGTGIDYDLAKEAFEKASLLNDQEGTCMLGYMYERGRGVSRVDKEKAIQLYLKAGKAGYMKAYNNLGTLYANLKDMDKAVYYWELAANANNQLAIGNLITFYKNRKNKEKEDYWRNLQKQKKSTK